MQRSSTLWFGALQLTVCLAACTGTTSSTSTSSVAGSSSSAGSAAGSSAGSTTGSEASSNSGTATGGTTSSTGAGSISSGATGTTTGVPMPVFVDGGYVACMLTPAADGGPNGDGGPAYWDCVPGTYFCDTSGDIGSCFQCLSDADCTNPNLPTYDPHRPHCDTSSGVPGAEHFCQECLTNSDCAGNPNGSYCDGNASPLQPPIETLGFETCIGLVTDCRVDGGPICGGVDQSCDSQTGQCLTRSGACASDEDCVGYLSRYGASSPAPYCSDAGFCMECPGGVCPSGFCTSDATCANGTICDLAPPLPSYTCKCTDSSQCGVLWPVCLDLQANDAGQVLGICSCDDSSECGDGGLVCLHPKGLVPFCGIPCTSPEFPTSCQAATAVYPVCDPQTGSCGPCSDDIQCRMANDPNGPRCDVGLGGPGNCGCDPKGNDCPTGEACQPGTYLGTCAPALAHCTPGSCSPQFCDWDSGTCVSAGTEVTPCLTDYDCAISGVSGPTCLGGRCIQCQSSADCVASGAAATGSSLCCLPGVTACGAFDYANNSCADACSVDADCTGNSYGGSCILSDAGYSRCGCGSDNDCAAYPYGHHCDLDPSSSFFAYCNCVADSDCPAGEACQISSGSTTGYCALGCYTADAGACGAGYFCDPRETCRPRCDDGNQCQGSDTVCDSQNVAGENGELMGPIPAVGVTWCYACTQASDCPAGEGCDPGLGCGHCSSDASCPAGTACVDGGLCQPTCPSGACPGGEVCDVHGLAGFGTDICYECLSPADCPNSEGCNSLSHTCGTCNGPTASTWESGSGDCPPDAVCSNYWTYGVNFAPGVCLANCDRTPCPSTQPICAVYAALTPDHKYCFACLKDSDCGANQHCNLSPDPTFTCVDNP